MQSILDYDPYGAYPLDALLKVTTPPSPKGFDSFWHDAFLQTLEIKPEIQLQDTGEVHSHWKIYRLSFKSTNAMHIGGWLLVPAEDEVKHAMIIGHGYGGRNGPDLTLPFTNTAIFFPCCRGISLSAKPPISEHPYWHVRHDIHKKQQYILRGCVQDIWLSVTVLETLYPHLANKVSLLGVSFSGGVGMLALAQDKRIARAHFNVPTFGQHRLRLRIPTLGSGKSLQDFYQNDPYTLIRTLRYFDAADAASRVTVPVHFALALRDPVVTPVGQFAIYNQVVSPKQLYILEAGHDSYPAQVQQQNELRAELKAFFN